MLTILIMKLKQNIKNKATNINDRKIKCFKELLLFCRKISVVENNENYCTELTLISGYSSRMSFSYRVITTRHVTSGKIENVDHFEKKTRLNGYLTIEFCYVMTVIS